MLKVYTARIGNNGLDITVKSGDPVFAPSWKIVMDLKNDKITWEQYVKKYTIMMRHSYLRNFQRWMEILRKKEVTLLCYCSDPNRCHRILLADMFVKVGEDKGINVQYMGERE